MTDEVIATDAEVLLEFMYRLGQAYLACGEQTAEVERLLRGTATAFGMRSARIVAFPTAVFITAARRGSAQRVTLAEGLSHGLRLDQIADIHALCNAAERVEVTPREGISRLAEILRQSGGSARSVSSQGIPSSPRASRCCSCPTLANLAGAAVLGFVVGLLKLVNRDRPVLALPTPVFAATLVSALTYLAVQQGLPVDPLYLLVPPLVTFLPVRDPRHGGARVRRHDCRNEPTCHWPGPARAAGFRSRGRRGAGRIRPRKPGRRGGAADRATLGALGAVGGGGCLRHRRLFPFLGPAAIDRLAAARAAAHVRCAALCGQHLQHRDERFLRHARRHPPRLPDPAPIQGTAGSGHLSAERSGPSCRGRSGCTA